MEIRRWLYYVVVNCALICYVAKPFSLNKLIESKSNQKEVIHTTLSPKIEKPEPAVERFSLNEELKPLNWIAKKYKETGTILNLIPLGNKISPFKYRKTFQINSPLKPKRVKYSLRTRQKRKNQSIKREIDGNAILNKKYVPLLRSLGMLFDNILGNDSGESFKKTKHKKRLRYNPNRDDDITCKCPRQRESDSETESEEETVNFSEALAPEIAVTTKVAAETTDNSSAGDLRSFRQHKNVPLLLSRNTSGTRRNNHGFSESSRAAHYGSTERYISGNNGDSEHYPKHGQEQSYAESDKEYTDSDSRNDASRARIQGTVRGREYRNNTKEIYENDAISQDEAENFLESRENTTQHNGPYKLETERNKAKSRKLLSELFRRQRGFIHNDKVIDFAKSIHSEENYEEGVVSIAQDSAGDQRLSDGDGPHSSEDKKANAITETVIYKLPEAANRYGSKSKATEVKGLISNLAVSEENDEYDESDVHIANESSERSLDTGDSKSTKNRKTNARSETELHEHHEPIVKQPRDSKEIKDKTLFDDSAETIYTEYIEESDGSTEHGSSIDVDSTHSAHSQTSAKPDTVHKLPEVENLKYMPKPKTSRSRDPVVTIIDGYSVTRHRNGENKLAEKQIRIRP